MPSQIWLADAEPTPVIAGCFRWFRWRAGALLAHREGGITVHFSSRERGWSHQLASHRREGF
jgi:hypothetical protein